MAVFTTSPDQRFKAGTVLHVYLATGSARPFDTASVTSATVAADGTATFTGLSISTRYIAGETINGPFVAFQITAQDDGVSNIVVYDADAGEWPPRPNIAEAVLFSAPQNVAPPATGMLAGDVFLRPEA